MSKAMQKKSKSSGGACYPDAKSKPLKDHNLIGVNPLKQQFEPTSTESVRQHNAMAGGS